MAKMVHAVGEARLEPAELLEIAARARLETVNPGTDTMIDGGIVANVEVQIAQLLERSPVPAIEDPIFLDVERTRDDPPLIRCGDKTQVALESVGEVFEKRLVEVELSPIQLFDMGFVELVKYRK